jgi:hypothetical protein
MKSDYDQYHLSHFAATDPWPNGGWSVYKITGDQIAERIEFAPRTSSIGTRKAVRRDSWCGYLGIGETLADAMKLIEEDQKV